MTVNATCDTGECGAAAQVEVILDLSPRQDVLFCGHHFNANRDVLYAKQDAGKLDIVFAPEAEWLRRSELVPA